MERAMNELDELRECEARLRMSAAWLRAPVEGHANGQLWRGDEDVSFLEADDGEVYAFERSDPSLRVELLSVPCGIW
jgi:hypothetical protein